MTQTLSLSSLHQKLEKHAEWYVAKYAPSSPTFKKNLTLWMKKKSIFPTNQSDAHATINLIEQLSQKYAQYGLINDREFIASRCRKWSKKGWSLQYIQQKLVADGLQKQLINEVIKELQTQNNTPSPQLHILSIMQKKNLTPVTSSPELNAKKKQKALAFIARRGFSHSDAINILKQIGF
jgi:SOS response regulatory protein OraA/RecX